MSGLTPEERNAVINAIQAAVQNSTDKPEFCKGWTVTRRVLVNLQYHLSADLGATLQKVIETGDLVCPG